MKISDLEFYLVAVPCSSSPRLLPSLVARLVCDSGHEGWGEAALQWRPTELEARRQAVLPLLAGRSLFDIAELLALDALRPRGLKAAIEMASWDAIGHVIDKPICHLWGGLYRARVPLAARLNADHPDAVAQRARALAERGFHTQILTSTGRPDADAAHVAAASDATGDHVELRLDAGGKLELDQALEICRALEKFESLRYVLDPVAGGDFDLTARLRRQTSTTVAVSSRLQVPANVMSVVRSQAAPFVVVDLDHVAGLSVAGHCATVAAAADLTASLLVRQSLGLKVAAMLQLAAATPSLSSANECGYLDLRDDILVDRLEIVDGMIAVPEGPGLGVEVNRAKLERYLVT